MRATYTCNKCNHGDCNIAVEDNDPGELNTPVVCPWDPKQPTNWARK